jgi:hypothetical protein
VWKLSRRDVLLGSMLQTGAVYSSMVAKTCYLRQAAAEVFKLENPFDNDKMLTFALTAYGSLLFRPAPTCFYRRHAQQDQNTFLAERKHFYLSKTTEWLVTSAGESWSLVADLLLKRLCDTPESERGRVKQMLLEPWCLPLIFANLEKDVCRVQNEFDAISPFLKLQRLPRQPRRVLKQFFRQPRKSVLFSFGWRL